MLNILKLKLKLELELELELELREEVTGQEDKTFSTCLNWFKYEYENEYEY
jgi:hypothetical protein